jgi:hypothetical protein
VTALMVAAQHRPESVKTLCDMPGIDLNAADNDGETALMMAAKYKLSTAVQILCNMPGIDFNATNNHGWTALMLAEKHGIEARKLLERKTRESKIGWRRINDESVRNVIFDTELQTGIMEIFNFSAQKVTTIGLDENMKASGKAFETSFYDYGEDSECFDPKYLNKAREVLAQGNTKSLPPAPR